MRKWLSVALAGLLLLGSTPLQARKVGYEKIYEQVAPSSVVLRMKIKMTNPQTGETKTGWGGCSGTLISKDGKILTAAHCIDVPENVQLVEVWVRTFAEKSYKATIVAKNSDKDLAVLDIEGDNHPFLLIGETPKPGQTVISVSSPLDLRWTFSQGHVSRLKHKFKDSSASFIQHTAMINPGSSGSSLLDEQGRIVGVNTRIIGFFLWNGLSYAVDTDEIRKFLLGALK